jgi:hypothetical protein
MVSYLIKTKINMFKKIIFAFLLTLSLSSCVVVKGYEQVNINDPDMALSPASVDRFETNYQAYRESASGGNSGKTGGGCGCN